MSASYVYTVVSLCLAVLSFILDRMLHSACDVSVFQALLFIHDLLQVVSVKKAPNPVWYCLLALKCPNMVIILLLIQKLHVYCKHVMNPLSSIYRDWSGLGYSCGGGGVWDPSDVNHSVLLLQ